MEMRGSYKNKGKIEVQHQVKAVILEMQMMSPSFSLGGGGQT